MTHLPARSPGRVLDYLASALKASPDVRTPGHDVEVIRDGDARAVAVALTFADGDRWEILAVRAHSASGPAVQELAEGVTYISNGNSI